MVFRTALPLLMLYLIGCAWVFAADTREFDPLSPPPVLKPVPNQYADSERIWQGISSLEATSNGRLWVCWYSGGATECGENYVLLSTSADRGDTWSKPIFAIDPPGMTRAFDPAIWLDPTGRLWVFWAQGEEWPDGPMPIWDGRAGVWAVTTENPEAGEEALWSAPRRICDGIMMGKPIVDSRKRWLFPVAIWRFPGKYTIPEEQRGVAVWQSSDEGKTFNFLGRSKADPAISLFDEQNIVEMKDGSLKMFARTRYGIGETVSADGGKTWTDLEPSPLKHTSSRFFVRRLASGNLLLIKNGPADQDVGRAKLTAMLSADDGKTWSGGLILDERNGVSYPDGNQSDDGTIYVTYDFDRYNAREVYAARFTEADVTAGKIVDQSSKLKLLVNKATAPLPATTASLVFSPNKNDEGVLPFEGDRAELTILRGKSIEKLTDNALLFTNRDYRAKNLPKFLDGKNFLLAPIDYSAANVARTGIVYVVTPRSERNKDNVIVELTAAGFTKVKEPEFLFFGNSTGNVSSVWQKKVEAGEKIEWDKKWGVLVF